MTLRERAADAMRLKDAEMRGVVGAPAWAQLTSTDQERWLALHDASADVRAKSRGAGFALRIRQDEVRPTTARFWLDGQEVSHGLTGVAVGWKVGGITTATLKITVDDLDVDAATLAVLQAHVQEQGEQQDVPEHAEITTLGDDMRRYLPLDDTGARR